MGAHHLEYALCWQPVLRLHDWGLSSLGSRSQGLPAARSCPACSSTPQCHVQCSCTLPLPPSRICHSQPLHSLGHNELKFRAQCLCTRYPLRKRNKTKHQGKDKKKVRVYCIPDSTFIFWQLLMVITPGNQKEWRTLHEERFWRKKDWWPRLRQPQHLMIG